MNLNLLTKKLYQLSVDKFGTLFFISILILSLIFVSSNQKAYAVTVITVDQDDAFTSTDLSGDKTLTKISGTTTIEGCKNKTGSTTNQGSFYAVWNAGGLIDMGSGNTQIVAFCNQEAGMPETLRQNDPRLNNYVYCNDGGGTSVNCSTYKVTVPKTTFQNPTTPSENYLEIYRSRQCDGTNKFLPICTNISTQLSSITDTKIDVKVSTSTTLSVDVSLNFNLCYYQGSSTGKQTKLLAINEGVSYFKFKCQCVTTKKNDGKYYGVFYVKSDGTTENILASDKNNVDDRAAFDIASRACFSGAGNTQTLQRFFGPETNKCYNDLNSCRVAENNANDGECELSQKGKYLYKPNGTGANYSEISFSSLINKYRLCEPYKSVTPATTSCKEVDSARRCDCNFYYNEFYDPVWCALPVAGTLKDWWDQSCTKEKCKLVPVNFQAQQPSPPESPLAFINVLVNVLFWLAVLLFIINFITAGIEMIRSGDEPEKMKEATGRITSSIFGFIFILIISGLINYLIDFVETFLTKR